MYKFQTSLFVNRPLQVVFDYVTDPANNAKWQSGTESVEWTSDDAPQVGSIFNWITSFLGRRIEGEMVMTSWGPPNQSGFITLQGPIPFEVTTRYEAQGDGTLITTDGQVESVVSLS